MSSLMKRVRCTVCAIMFCAIMISILQPSVVLASEGVVAATNSRTVSKAFLDEYRYDARSPTDKSVVKEMISKRTETSKTFLCADGSYITEHCSEPIGFTDANGKVQLFDNGIVADSTPGFNFKNANNKYSVHFGCQNTTTYPVLLENGNHSLKFKMDAIESMQPRHSNLELPNVFATDKAEELVYYGNSNTGVLFAPHNDGLNQKTLYKAKEFADTLTISMNIGNLNYTMSEGNILIYDDNADCPIFIFEKPVLISANGNICNDATISLIDTENTQDGRIITIEQSFDNESEDIVYPVELNSNIITLEGPTLAQRVHSNLQVATVSSTNNLGSNYIQSGYNNRLYRTYLRCTTLNPMLLGYSLDRAVIELKRAGSSYTLEHDNLDQNALNGYYTELCTYKVDTSWNSSTITWANQPLSSSTVLSSSTAIRGHMDDYGTQSSPDWYTIFDITNSFAYNDLKGYCISLYDESRTSQSYVKWYSNNSIISNAAPRIKLYLRSTAYSYPERSVNAHVQMNNRFNAKLADIDMALFNYSLGLFDDLSYPFEQRWNISWYFTSNPTPITYPTSWEDTDEDTQDNTYTFINYDYVRQALDQQVADNNGALPNNADILITMLGYDCMRATYDGDVINVAGMTSAPWQQSSGLGEFCTVTPNVSNRTAEVYLMWHELSHAFGCHHNGNYNSYTNQYRYCTPGQLCCMRTGFDCFEVLNLRTIWCDDCATNYFDPTRLD